MFGDQKAVPYGRSKYQKAQAQISPDGQWLAYTTNDSGGIWPVTAKGGSEPRWRGDGRELYYLAPDGKLMAVPVKGALQLRMTVITLESAPLEDAVMTCE
jgi:hypothetical protein